MHAGGQYIIMADTVGWIYTTVHEDTVGLYLLMRDYFVTLFMLSFLQTKYIYVIFLLFFDATSKNLSPWYRQLQGGNFGFFSDFTELGST